MIDMKRFLLLPFVSVLLLAGCAGSKNAASVSGNETVFDGYTHQPKESNTTSISTIENGKRNKRNYETIYDMLIGEVAGVRVDMTGNNSANIYIRGKNSISGIASVTSSFMYLLAAYCSPVRFRAILSFLFIIMMSEVSLLLWL